MFLIERPDLLFLFLKESGRRFEGQQFLGLGVEDNAVVQLVRLGLLGVENALLIEESFRSDHD